jgi:hypothetical protein
LETLPPQVFVAVVIVDKVALLEVEVEVAEVNVCVALVTVEVFVLVVNDCVAVVPVAVAVVRVVKTVHTKSPVSEAAS